MGGKPGDHITTLPAGRTTGRGYIWKALRLGKLPFIRSLYRRIPLEFYGKNKEPKSTIFAALWAIEMKENVSK
jgi:hypothetical protein